MNLDVKVQTLINTMNSTSLFEHSEFKLFLNSPIHIIMLVVLKCCQKKTQEEKQREGNCLRVRIKEYYLLQVLVLCCYGYMYQTVSQPTHNNDPVSAERNVLYVKFNLELS